MIKILCGLFKIFNEADCFYYIRKMVMLNRLLYLLDTDQFSGQFGNEMNSAYNFCGLCSCQYSKKTAYTQSNHIKPVLGGLDFLRY